MSFFDLFKRQKKKVKLTFDNTTHAHTLLFNDAVSIIHDATKVCWDKPPADNYKDKKIFINKRIKTGHESILEHGNVAMFITINEKYIYDIIEVIGAPTHYLNISTRFDEANKCFCFIVGGSIRAYKHFIREMINRENVFYKLVINQLYECTVREFWTDLIDDGILKDRFAEMMVSDQEFMDSHDDFDISKENYSEYHPIESKDPDKIEIVNIDDLNLIKDYAGYYKFTINDCLDMATVTIKFKHMSRVITQQLVRHRNAITQASGRYIDLSDKVVFNDPCNFKDTYNKDGHYIITINNVDFMVTLQELGDMLCGVYSQVKRAGIAKEDARGFLPQNAQCGDIYMTFTYRSLLKFLELRRHPSAQAEIRMYANIIYDSLFDTLVEKLCTIDLYKYLEPKYKLYSDENTNYYSEIDEILEEKEIEENVEGSTES